jgi:enterochelin esterase-like enzyme
MEISASTTPGCHDATFTWYDREPSRLARAVLLRLLARTDYAFDDGDVRPYLMCQNPDGAWTLTLTLPSHLRSSYQFCPIRDPELAGEVGTGNLAEERWTDVLALGEPDEANGLELPAGTVRGTSQPVSIVELPEAPAQPWRDRRNAVVRGGLTRYEVGGSVVHVYRPASAGERTPLVVLFDARFWLAVDVVTTLDNLIADGATPPLTAVVIESIRGAERRDALTHPALFESFLLDELLPWMRTQWTVDATGVTVAGQSLGGIAASYTALRHPEVFAGVITSSMAAWWPGDSDDGLSGEAVIEAYRDAPRLPLRFFLEVGSVERHLLDSVRLFHKALVEQRYDVTYREYEGGHDVACWRGGLADGLAALLG